MGVRYIGSKARVADEIVEILGMPTGATFIDGFCGTGTVAAAAARVGWPVRINDHLFSSVVMASASLIGQDDVRFEQLGGYKEAIYTLNSLEGVDGFIHREYTPASRVGGVERKYFTETNGRRIDAVRAMIRVWREARLITGAEHELLIADLMGAANGVANIAGTYGCFLKDWSPQSLKAIRLRARNLPTESAKVEVHVGDVTDVPASAADVAYYDPPYTKRQYAAYYHLLETIALGDEPIVGGVTGLRPWRHLASDFCYRTRALGALGRLVADSPAQRVLLSYSSEGHVSRSELEQSLGSLGDLTVHQVGTIGRYRPNEAASAAASSVHEYLFELVKSPIPAPVGAPSA